MKVFLEATILIVFLIGLSSGSVSAALVCSNDFNVGLSGFTTNAGAGTITLESNESDFSSVSGGSSVNLSVSDGDSPRPSLSALLDGVPGQARLRIAFDYFQDSGQSTLFQLRDSAGNKAINIYIRYWDSLKTIQINQGGTWVDTGVQLNLNEWYHFELAVDSAGSVGDGMFDLVVTDTSETVVLSRTFGLADGILSYDEVWWSSAGNSEYNIDNVVVETLHATTLLGNGFNVDVDGFTLFANNGNIGIEAGVESLFTAISGGDSVNLVGGGDSDPVKYGPIMMAALGSVGYSSQLKIAFDYYQDSGDGILFQLSDYSGVKGINIYIRNWKNPCNVNVRESGDWTDTGVNIGTNEWVHFELVIDAANSSGLNSFDLTITDSSGSNVLSEAYDFDTDISSYNEIRWSFGEVDTAANADFNIDNVRVESIPAPSTTYYVSENGNDSNPGSETLPFETIQAAANLLWPGDVCTIREGIYRETVIPAADGTDELPIVFQAFSNETVEITGCEAVPAWTLHSGSIYKATVGMALGDENQVFRRSGGSLTNLWLARWPNSTDRWNPVYAAADSGTYRAILKDSDLPAYDYAGARIRIHDDPAWGLYDQSITNWSAGELQTDYHSLWYNHDMTAGTEYFVYNCYDALDADGEWFFDSADNTLYFVSTGGSPGSGDIEVKTRPDAFDLRGRRHVMLKGLTLTAGTILTDDESSDCIFDRLDVEYPYYSSLMDSQVDQATKGVVLMGSGHILKNSEVAWASGSGVRLWGERMEVVNCYIHDCNYAGSYAAALLGVREGRRHVLSHNTLVRTGRSCIDMKSGVSRVLIQYNEMAWCGRLTGDLGVLYAPGAAVDGSEIRYNWCHDNESASHSSGIYFDNGGKNALIHHNVVWGPLTHGGLHVNQYALGIQMYNNTMVNTGSAYLSTWGNLWPDDMYGSRFINNLGAGGIDSDGIEIVYDANLTNYSGVVSNLYLPSGSPAEDAGRVVPGITDGYIGAGPDIGAYERGGTDWTVGHDFSTEPQINRTLSDCPTMNRLSNSAFEFGTLESWTAEGDAVSINYQVVSQDQVLTNTAMGGRYSIALGDGTNRISQVVTNLLPNSAYEYRGRLRADSGESVLIGVCGAGLADVQSGVVSNNSPVWSDTRIPFITGETNTSAVIYVQKTSTGSGTVYVDDFSVFYQRAAAGVSYVGIDTNASDGWRSTSVSKPFDIDGDNIYGSAGYLAWATGNTGDIHSGDYYADSKLEALPTGITVSGPGVNEKSYSGSYRAFDDPSSPPGATVSNVASGLAYRTDCGENIWRSVATITVGTVPVGTLRVGVIHNGGGDTVNAVAMSQVGVQGTWVNSSTLDTRGPEKMRYCFFDLDHITAGDQFNVLLRGSDFNDDNAVNLGLAGLSFDVYAHHLTAVAGVGGTIAGSPNGSYAVNSTATVTAVASDYYSWGHWTGGVPVSATNDNSLALIMDTNRTVTAVFAENLAENGVPEWWLAQYGWTNNFDAASMGDPDGDGVSTWQEYFAGTSPVDRSSVLAIDKFSVQGSNRFVFRWQAVSNKTYAVLSATNLLSNVWKTNAIGISGVDPAFTGEVCGVQSFFRISVE